MNFRTKTKEGSHQKETTSSIMSNSCTGRLNSGKIAHFFKRVFDKELWFPNGRLSVGKLDDSFSYELHKEKTMLFVPWALKYLKPSDEYKELIHKHLLKLDDRLPVPYNETGIDGQIIGFNKYQCSKSKKYIYKPVQDSPKLNPYRQYCNRQSSANKQFAKLQNLPLSVTLSRIVLTFPGEVSEEYEELETMEERKEFENKLWDCFKDFFDWLKEYKDASLGASVSLHTWKTSDPLHSHLHFHCHIPMLEAPYTTRSERVKWKLKKVLEEFKNVRGIEKMRNTEKLVNSKHKELTEDFVESFDIKRVDFWKPYKPFNHSKLKEKWSQIVSEKFGDIFTSETGLDQRLPLVNTSKPVDLNLSWVKAKDRAKLKHALAYKVRPQEVDLAQYLEKNKAKDYNKDFIRLSLTSRTETRVFGYWVTLTNLETFGYKEKGHYCPICGAKMEHKGFKSRNKFDCNDYTTFFEQRNYTYQIYEPPPLFGSQKSKSGWIGLND